MKELKEIEGQYAKTLVRGKYEHHGPTLIDDHETGGKEGEIEINFPLWNNKQISIFGPWGEGKKRKMVGCLDDEIMRSRLRHEAALLTIFILKSSDVIQTSVCYQQNVLTRRIAPIHEVSNFVHQRTILFVFF